MASNTFFLDQSESQKRQFIDAETVFLAATQAKKGYSRGTWQHVLAGTAWQVNAHSHVGEQRTKIPWIPQHRNRGDVCQFHGAQEICRRAAKNTDPHPLRMSDEEDDFWARQVSMGEKLQSARRMDQVVVATSGEMALMRTVHPLDFGRIKQALSKQVGRDPNKSGKDALQSRIVTELVNGYLPHFLPAEGGNPLVQ